MNLVRNKINDTLFAQKILTKEKIPLTGKRIQHILNEKRILQQVGNARYCVHLIDTFQDATNLYINMEYLSGGELYNNIRLNGFQKDGPELKFYLAEIVCALEQLHNQQIIYRDLKPENLLIDGRGHVRLIDFGFSKFVTDSSMKATTNCGTPGYVAPEVALMGQRTNSWYDGRASDVWSFGVLICELIGGYSPFRIQLDEN